MENPLQAMRRQRGVLIATHRGVVGANIPHNTIPAFELALMQGTDILETDVTCGGDGTMYIFHPGKEQAQLGAAVDIRTLDAQAVNALRYLNDDRNPTQLGILTLDAFLETYKGRCVLNLDHGWKCFPELIRAVRRHAMADQILLKAPANEQNLQAVAQLAPDMMFMGIIKQSDTVTPLLERMHIRYVAAELIFDRENAPLLDPGYIESQHAKGRLLWCNAIVYDYRKVLSAGHTDDVAVLGDPDQGWGWLADKGFDIIQTDWTLALRQYLDRR